MALGKVISLLGAPSVTMMMPLFWQAQQMEPWLGLAWAQGALASPGELSLKAAVWQETAAPPASLQAVEPSRKLYRPAELKYWPSLKREVASGVLVLAGSKKPPVILVPSQMVVPPESL